MKYLKLVPPLLILLTLSGCGGAAVMLASAALSGLGGAVGGGMSSGMESTGSTGSYRSPNMASSVQNGGQVDESIGQALQVSDQDVTSACKQRLPEESNLPLAAGECEVRMTCLPGAKMPMRMRVCMPPDTSAADEITADSEAVSRAPGQAL
ncbi:MAG: hypothetical protein ACQETX_07010 [Pseudomonadota bacterium]